MNSAEHWTLSIRWRRILYDRLVQANLKKDSEILQEVLVHLRTMRDTWKEVMRIAKTQKPQ